MAKWDYLLEALCPVCGASDFYINAKGAKDCGSKKCIMHGKTGISDTGGLGGKTSKAKSWRAYLRQYMTKKNVLSLEALEWVLIGAKHGLEHRDFAYRMSHIKHLPKGHVYDFMHKRKLGLSQTLMKQATRDLGSYIQVNGRIAGSNKSVDPLGDQVVSSGKSKGSYKRLLDVSFVPLLNNKDLENWYTATFKRANCYIRFDNKKHITISGDLVGKKDTNSWNITYRDGDNLTLATFKDTRKKFLDGALETITILYNNVAASTPSTKVTEKRSLFGGGGVYPLVKRHQTIVGKKIPKVYAILSDTGKSTRHTIQPNDVYTIYGDLGPVNVLPGSKYRVKLYHPKTDTNIVVDVDKDSIWNIYRG